MVSIGGKGDVLAMSPHFRIASDAPFFQKTVVHKRAQRPKVVTVAITKMSAETV